MKLSQTKFSLFGFTLSLLVGASSAQTALEIVPAAPKGQETVRVRVGNVAGGTGVESVSMNANRIAVMLSPPGIIPLVPPGSLDVVVGQLPAGVYDVEVFYPSTTLATSLGVRRFTVADERAGRVANAPEQNWTDIWWDPAEPGWGINITVKNNVFFAAWYVYDAGGKASWYTFQGGNWVGRACYVGPVYKTSGSAWGGIASQQVMTVSQVGSARICFLGYDSAAFGFTVEGQTSSKNIVRFM